MYNLLIFYLYVSVMCINELQGRAQEVKKGEGAQFEAVRFRPKVKERVKKGQHVPAQSQVKSKKGQRVRKCPIFRFYGLKSSEEQKKRSSRPQIVLYTYITLTPRKFCAFFCEGRGAARAASPWICP